MLRHKKTKTFTPDFMNQSNLSVNNSSVNKANNLSSTDNLMKMYNLDTQEDINELEY